MAGPTVGRLAGAGGKRNEQCSSHPPLQAMASAEEAADMNLDLMVAKVPHWFMRLSGWEGRLVVRAGMRAAATQGACITDAPTPAFARAGRR